jgi:hypothetical protein
MSKAQYGQNQTEQLIHKIEKQLKKFLDTLNDLEEEKSELDEDEYNLIKQEAIDSMTEFEKTLTRLTSGDVSLIDKLGAMRLAMMATVSNAFKTPEVIAMFAKKEPKLLRDKLAELQRDVKLGKVTKEIFTQTTIEILGALQKLGEKLSETEQNFLDKNITQELKNFVLVDQDVKQKQNILMTAGSQIQKAQK